MKTESNLRINETPDLKKWDDYVLQHPQGNIFQTTCMFNVYKSTPHCSAGVVTLEDNNGNILGLMVYSIIAEPGMKSRFSKRSIITGGPLVTNNDPTYTKVLLDSYKKLSGKRARSIPSLEISTISKR